MTPAERLQAKLDEIAATEGKVPDKGSYRYTELERRAHQEDVTVAAVLDAQYFKRAQDHEYTMYLLRKIVAYEKLLNHLGSWLNGKPHLRNAGPLGEIWTEYQREKF